MITLSTISILLTVYCMYKFVKEMIETKGGAKNSFVNMIGFFGCLFTISSIVILVIYLMLKYLP